jgi:hypothetical protein
MKKILTICALLLNVISQAQQARIKTNEIGMFVETSTNNNNFNNRSFGLQYKKTNKPNHAFRFQLLFNQSSLHNEPYEYAIVGDTIKTKQVIQENHAIFVGFGLEQQRHFYKNCFLYASLDARIGYGSADYYRASSNRVIDTLNNVYFSNPFRDFSSQEKINSIQSHRFVLDLMPSIGSKLVTRNLVFGIETGLNLSNAYVSQKGSGINNYSIYDFSLSLFYYRLYVNYRL